MKYKINQKTRNDGSKYYDIYQWNNNEIVVLITTNSKPIIELYTLIVKLDSQQELLFSLMYGDIVEGP
jgi:hypothetical protein